MKGSVCLVLECLKRMQLFVQFQLLVVDLENPPFQSIEEHVLVEKASPFLFNGIRFQRVFSDSWQGNSMPICLSNIWLDALHTMLQNKF